LLQIGHSVRVREIGETPRLAAVIVSLAVIAAGLSGAVLGRDTVASSTTAQHAANLVSVSANTPQPTVEPINTCDRRSQSEGSTTPPVDWRERYLLVGNAGLQPDLYAHQPPLAFEPQTEHEPQGAILWVVVEAASTAKILIPEANRGSVFFNDLAAFHPPGTETSVVDQAVPAIRLEACLNEDTMFGVGIFPLGAQCVPLEVSSPDGTPPTGVTLSFGAGVCTQLPPRMTG
jgi:hypothetical protein